MSGIECRKAKQSVKAFIEAHGVHQLFEELVAFSAVMIDEYPDGATSGDWIDIENTVAKLNTRVAGLRPEEEDDE